MLGFKLFLEAKKEEDKDKPKAAEEWHVLKTSEFHRKPTKKDKKKPKDVKEDYEHELETSRPEHDGGFRNPKGIHDLGDAVKHHLGVTTGVEHTKDFRDRLKAHYHFPIKTKTQKYVSAWTGHEHKTEVRVQSDAAHIRNYSSGSSDLNSYLHTHHGTAPTKVEKAYGAKTRTSRTYGDHIRGLDKALTRHAAPESFHVFTGIRSDPRDLEHDERKKYIQGIKNPMLQKHGSDHWKVRLPAYTSTSINPGKAAGFTYAHDVKPEDRKYSEHHYSGHILHVEIPKGSNHGAYIEHHSEYPKEHEFLMRRGARLHVNKTPTLHREGDTLYHIWHAKVVDHETALPTKTAKPKGLARLNTPTAKKVDDQ